MRGKRDINQVIGLRWRIAKRRLSRIFDKLFSSDPQFSSVIILPGTPPIPVAVEVPAQKCLTSPCDVLREYRILLRKRGYEVNLTLPQKSSGIAQCKACLIQKAVDVMKVQESQKMQQEEPKRCETAIR